MSIVRVWLLATFLAMVCGLIWGYAPILIPVLGIAAGLGFMTWGIVSGARALERRRRPHK
jgi:hypothetical protein